MKLQVRMNLRAKAVEMRTCPETEDAGALQKGADFVKAYCLGFAVDVSNSEYARALVLPLLIVDITLGCHCSSATR